MSQELETEVSQEPVKALSPFENLHVTEKDAVRDFVTARLGLKGEKFEKALDRLAANQSWVDTVVNRSRQQTGKPPKKNYYAEGQRDYGVIKDILDRVEQTPALQR